MSAAGTKRGEAKKATATRSSNPAQGTSAAKVSGALGSLPDGEPTNAVALLEADHRAVAKLFAAFEKGTGDAEMRDIAIAICVALKVHARLEEELFYPAVADALDDLKLLEEALVEHASARDLIAQIEAGAPGEALYSARVKVLGEYVKHHVAEEEKEIFSRCGDLDLDALGAAMTMRKQELSLGFVVSNPVIGLANPRGDANT